MSAISVKITVSKTVNGRMVDFDENKIQATINMKPSIVVVLDRLSEDDLLKYTSGTKKKLI